MGIQENMASVIRMIKRSRRKSTVEFSEELEISPSTLQDYMKAQGNPTIQMIERLAEKMNIDPIALMSGKIEEEQYQIVILMLDTIQAVADLPQPKRLKFAELFLELIHLWEEEY